MLGIWATSCSRPPALIGLVNRATRSHRTLVFKPRTSLVKQFQTHRPYTTPPTPPQTSKSNDASILSRVLPFRGGPQNTSSLRKIVALAQPETKPLLAAIGLLLASSAVSMSVPFTIGKLIDFFSTNNPVRSAPRFLNLA